MNVAFIYTEKDRDALGMRSVAAAVKAKGHHTRLFLMGTELEWYTPPILENLKSLVNDMDLIGISSFSRGSDKARQVIRYLKPLDKFIIWGGVHATLNPHECAQEADLVCVGEGEDFMQEFMDIFQNNQDCKSITGAAFTNQGQVIVNPRRNLIRDLDTLPVVDFSHENEYHLINEHFVPANGNTNDIAPIMFNGTRGCAFQCTYCSNAKIKSILTDKHRYVRKLSPAEYIRQAKICREQFPERKYFYFVDEDFFARSIKEIKQFADLYPKEIGLPFECMASPLQISKEKMTSLVDAGLWRIDMGIESGSERTKKEIYNRPMSNSSVRKAADIINKYRQVIPTYFIIIGNPFEEQEDLKATINFLKELPSPYYLRTYDLVFLPGTILYDMAVEKGIISGKSESAYEIDFLAGLDYKTHPWKKKNLYLNGLLYLMAGRVNNFRMGLLPRRLFPILLKDRMIEFQNRHGQIMSYLITFKMFLLKLRTNLSQLIKKHIDNPTAVYNLKDYLRHKIKNKKLLLIKKFN